MKEHEFTLLLRSESGDSEESAQRLGTILKSLLRAHGFICCAAFPNDVFEAWKRPRATQENGGQQ